MALMTIIAGVTCSPVHAGVMHEDASYQTYTDFGQNRGRYVVGTSVNALLQHIRTDVDNGILIHYTDGTAPYTISNAQGMINFAATDDIGAQVAVSPTFAATVLHNGSISASYGHRVVGSEHAINYKAIDIRYSDKFRLAPGNGSGSQYDYMLQRQSKIVTDAVWNPVTGVTDMDTLDGKLIYHSGAGGMGVWTEENGKVGLAGAYTFIIGGINNVSNAQTHASATATNTSIHQNPGYGNGVGASELNPLPNAIQGGDSGSPIFIYNEATQQYEYLAAQQSGGGNSYGQARGDVVWTHTALESFNQAVNTGAEGKVKLGAINNAGELITDNRGNSTQIYTGKVTDANGVELAEYRGIQSGQSTWSDLSDVKDNANWYAYTDHLQPSVADLFYNDNLVFTAGTANNVIELQDTVDLGVGYVEFNRGNQEHARFDITAKDGAGYLLNSAGYVINEGAEVHISFTNPSDHMYEWRKNGAGDLYIEGSGDTNALLTVGGSGTSYLKRTDGYAAYNVLASSGANVVIDNVGQIKRGFTFGAGGGTLDMNGNSMDWYSSTTGEDYFTINALTEQAMIANNGTQQSTLTYREGGEQTYAGSWRDSASGALRIHYSGGGTWVLNSIHTDLSHHAASGLTVNNGTVRLIGTNTVHGMGSVNARNNARLVVANDWHYADAAMNVDVKNGATFELGSHARLTGDVNVEQGGTFIMREGVQNRYEYVEGGAVLEDTYKYADYWGLKGNVVLNGTMNIQYSDAATTNSTLEGDISGSGHLKVNVGTKGGSLTLAGDNRAFTGSKHLQAGHVLATSLAALGSNESNKWLISAAGQLQVNGESSPNTLLAHVDSASTGTLVLSGHTSEVADMSNHRGLYLGAAEDCKLMYGPLWGDTELQAVDNVWRLGGGGGELLVHHKLSGENTLLLGAAEGAKGTVTLCNTNNDFSGTVVYNSRGILLKAGSDTLGNAGVLLANGHRLLATDAGVVNRVVSYSMGMLMADSIGNSDIDLSRHHYLSLGAQSAATLRGDIILADGDSYRFGAADGATLTVESELDNTRDIVVDAQGYSGGKVVLAGPNNTLNGNVTVQGSHENGLGGNIALAIAQDTTANGRITLAQGGSLDVAGHTLTVKTSLEGSGGAVKDSAGTGALVFAAENGDLTTGADLQLNTVRKTGSHTLTLNGNNSFDNFYVEGGTLNLTSGSAAGAGVIHLADSTSLQLGDGAIKFNLNVAEGDSAQITKSGTVLTTMGGNIQLGEGAKLALTGSGNYALSGSRYGGAGAEIAVGTAALHFASNSAVNIDGNLSTDHDLCLYSDGTATDMARNIAALQVSNGSTVTLDERTWNTVWNIGSLNGNGNLLWTSNTTHSNNSRLVLSAEGSLTGDIKLDRNYSNAARTHGAIIELAHDLAAQNATITLDGAGANAVASLAVNTADAHIRGLNGNAHSYVYAGQAQVAAAITGEARPATTRAAVLTIVTAAGTEYTYAGSLGNSADTSANGLSLVKEGAGIQNLTGAVSVNDVTVLDGTLSIAPGDSAVRGDVAIAGGARLSMGDYVLGEGRSFSVLAGEAGAPAEFGGNLVLAGGSLQVDGTALSQDAAVLSVQGVSLAENVSNQTVTISDFFSLDVGTYTVADGDWSAVVGNLTAAGLVIYDGSFSAATDGSLQLTLNRAAGVHEWGGAATGNWNSSDNSWQGGGSFVNGQTAYFKTNANLSVAEDVQVQNLVIGRDVQLATNGGVQVTGSVMGAAGSVWVLTGGEQSLTESQAAGVEQLRVDEAATLRLTGTPSARALDNVSGSGTVVLNYAMNGNGTGFDFTGLTGTVQLDKGRILVSSSTFGELAPAIHLTSGNSQLVFNGEGTQLNSNVQLGANTTIHVNNGKTGTMNGVVSGTGGLTKAGGGELTFTAQNTYTGVTYINAGRLVLDLAAGNGGNTYTLHNDVRGGTLAVQEGTTLAANGKNIGSNLELNGAAMTVTDGDTTVSGSTTGESSVITLGREGSGTYENGGVLTFNGRVDNAAHLKVGDGQAVFAYTGQDGNRVSIVDAGLGGKAVGQVVVKSGAGLDIEESLFLSSEDGGRAAVQVEKGGVMTHAGIAVVGTEEATPASVRAHTSRGRYSVGSGNFTVANALVAKTTEGSMTVANKLDNVRVQNDAAGTLTVTNSANRLTGLQATGGSIVVHNSSVLSLNVLEVAANQSVSAYTGSAANPAQLASVQVSQLASFGDGSVLNANLELGAGSILNMDGAVTLNGQLTLGSGTVLSGTVYEQLFAAQAGESVLLMSGVTSVTLADATMTESLTLNGRVLAENCFANGPAGTYLVYEQGNLSLLVNSPLGPESMQQVQLPLFSSYGDVARYSATATPVALALVPEPTTATLSLLALAALAARRRRK